MGGILKNKPYTHNMHVHCTLYRYVKALDRRAKVLRKLSGKLMGGDENLNLKIEYLRQALEVIYAFTLQKTFFRIFFVGTHCINAFKLLTLTCGCSGYVNVLPVNRLPTGSNHVRRRIASRAW